MDFLITYQTALTALVGIAIASGVIWRRAIRPMGKLVQAQLVENGGGSLVDKVNKISANHIQAEEHWLRLENKQEEIAANLADGFRTATHLADDHETRIKRLEAVVIMGRGIDQ